MDSYAQGLRQSAEVLRSVSEAMERQVVVPSDRIEHRARWMLVRMHCAKIDAAADAIEYGEVGGTSEMDDDDAMQEDWDDDEESQEDAIDVANAARQQQQQQQLAL